MRIVFYSGVFNIGSLGATRTIDKPLVSLMMEMGHRVIWAGCGKFNEAEKNIDLEKNRICVFLERINRGVKKKFFKFDQQRELLKRYIIFDKKLAEKINNAVVEVDSDTWLIGRNAMSFHSFMAAKERGVKTLLHSQWMHPYCQKAILEKHFSRLGIETKPIIDERVERQIREIDVVDKIWCISSLVKDSFLSNGLPEKKLFLVPLGVDYKKYSSISSDIGEKDKRFTILFVGNVNPEKGVHILMESLLLSGLQNIDMVFNGFVPDYFKPVFTEYAKKLEKQDVKVRIEPGDPTQNYRKASLFVLPSIHESFGLVVLEAMASGLPVIVSDSVGAKDCVIDGKTGKIFKSENAEELANAIQSFHLDKTLCYKTGIRAQQHAAKYDWNLIVLSLIEKLKTF